jgi:hypothetical protein
LHYITGRKLNWNWHDDHDDWHGGWNHDWNWHWDVAKPKVKHDYWNGDHDWNDHHWSWDKAAPNGVKHDAAEEASGNLAVWQGAGGADMAMWGAGGGTDMGESPLKLHVLELHFLFVLTWCSFKPSS